MLSTEFTNKLKESKQGQEYLDLIEQASLRNLESPDVEVHYIFPKSLQDFLNKEWQKGISK